MGKARNSKALHHVIVVWRPTSAQGTASWHQFCDCWRECGAFFWGRGRMKGEEAVRQKSRETKLKVTNLRGRTQGPPRASSHFHPHPHRLASSTEKQRKPEQRCTPRLKPTSTSKLSCPASEDGRFRPCSGPGQLAQERSCLVQPTTTDLAS